ncbi:hypothetical protein NGM37_50185, partial [Streptomyces sp. TRM76130]|nr:hypothetical protein [Streptomyces sp. TRM76130]
RLPRPLARRVSLLEAALDAHGVPWVPAWRPGYPDGLPPRGTEALTRLTGPTWTTRATKPTGATGATKPTGATGTTGATGAEH